MRDIKQQVDKISLNYFEHVKNSKNKGKAFGECVRSSLTQVTANSRYKKLEEELGAVLKDILEGLEKLHHFLDAVEKLSVTSQFVFTEQSFLPKGESPESVQSVITAAIMTSPLLIHFKRNAEAFFFPAISNVDVLVFHLDKYIHIAKEICGKMGGKSKSVSCCRDSNKCKKAQHLVRFSLNVCEDSMQKMLDHLNQLTKTRMDQNIRLTFLFQKHAQDFIDIFSKSHSRMEQFLSDLEEKAVQLDKMKKGANISSVAGSSVGIAGGVLSIVGLALAPVTAGASLALTLTGVGLGVTSGVNSLVTGITEVAVNRHHGKNAQDIFHSFMDDVTKILDCLEQASNEKNIEGLVKVDVVEAGRLIFCAQGLVRDIDSLVDTASAIKVLKNEEVIATAAKVGLQEAQNGRNIPKLAADLPDIGQLAKGTPLALSKSARAGFITVNALFVGLDVFFIYKDSKSIAKGSPCQASQLIRSRAALWKSELEAWRKIHDSLCIGKSKLTESKKVLKQPFFDRIL
ncbi:apolipo L4-like protein [Labeo rohita]|uniref:Apolipo L4-like protein n=1 Tax=Labeo rohita TaxID=84645 RepID=A0A498MBB6_LABRO|nr:apolipo L4-like protein [Labeo rohita]